MLANLIEIETSHGFKAIELHEGDLTTLATGVDLLVISAYPRSYHPTSGTVIHALESKRSIVVRDLAFNPAIDQRDSLGVWLSYPLNDPIYGRIACVESNGVWEHPEALEQALRNLFSLLAIAYFHDVMIETVALPVLATGSQGISVERVVPALVNATERALRQFAFLKKVLFVERNPDKVRELDSAFNNHLRRETTLTDNVLAHDMARAITAELFENLVKLRHRTDLSPAAMDSIREFIYKIHEEGQLRFFELGILSRRLAEALVRQILGVTGARLTFFEGIEALRDKRVASWIITYLHTVRTFGNEAAHGNADPHRIPASIHFQDQVAILFCLNRLLDFWLRFERSGQPS